MTIDILTGSQLRTLCPMADDIGHSIVIRISFYNAYYLI